MTTKVIALYFLEGGNWTRYERTPIPATTPGVQPTGAGIVRIQDIAVSGDTLSQSVSRLTTAAKVSFPVGVVEMVDFADAGKFGALLSSKCIGLLGSGIDQTIFRVKAGSSTKVGSVPTTGTNPLYVIRTATNPTGGFTASGFTVYGTDQPGDPNIGNRPHCYGGIMLDHVAAPILTDIKFIGIPGSSNSPPGETFQLNEFGCTNGIYTRIESDGRTPTATSYYAAGARVSASPFGFNDSTNPTKQDCYGHHSLTSMPTAWETVKLTTYNERSEYNGTGSGSLRGHGFNHERVSGAVRHHAPTWIVDYVNGNRGLHMSLLSDQANDTDIIIYAPTFDAVPTYHNEFGVQMNTGTYQGNPSTQTAPPQVTENDGVTMRTALDGNALPGTFAPLTQFIWFH